MTKLEKYFNNTQSPWGKLFYKAVWEQLNFAKKIKILDFGSGFGITANYLAYCNQVIAVEPNINMIEMRIKENSYTQLNGGIELLNDLADEEFDLIVCHNVFEYVDEKDRYVEVFSQLLKSGGKLSLVKHNHYGRILQRVAHDNDVTSALSLLSGEPAVAQNFGEIKYYDAERINKWIKLFGLKKAEHYGIRTFFALHPDNSKYTEDWSEQMYKLESKVCQIEEFRNIAFFNHIILEKL